MGAATAAQRDVWTRDGLSSRERRLVTIACVGFACTPEPIIEQVHAALESGELTVDEMLEVVLHFAVYCGWPKASNLEMYVRQTWARVQEERGERADSAPRSDRPMSPSSGPDDWEARIARGEEEFARREPRAGARSRLAVPARGHPQLRVRSRVAATPVSADATAGSSPWRASVSTKRRCRSCRTWARRSARVTSRRRRWTS